MQNTHAHTHTFALSRLRIRGGYIAERGTRSTSENDDFFTHLLSNNKNTATAQFKQTPNEDSAL